MRFKVRETPEAKHLKGRTAKHWNRRAGLLLAAAALLGVMVTGCKPSATNSAKSAGTNTAKAGVTNAMTGRPQAVPKANPAPGPMPRPFAHSNQAAAAHPPVRPNGVPPVLRLPPGKTGPLAAGARTGVRTNAPAAATTAGAKPWDAAIAKLRHLQTSPYFYPAVTVAVLCIVFGVIFLVQFLKAKSGKRGETLPAEVAPKLAARPVTKKARKAPISACNVLQVTAEARHLWQFASKGRGFVLSREQTSLGAEPLPANAIAKDWRNLWQRRLNIAWLPPEQVFLRVAQFPVSDFDETVAMVELQLEKLSPMPVAQVVWSIQVLPQAEGNLQTVIVMIAGRNAVEEFLGKLEGQGFLADRLEMPRLDQLRATTVSGDGAWIYPDPASASPTALVAWWYGGVLQNLALITLPPANRPASLKEQLLQMAWAGEMEGWLTAPPSWHLVADPQVAAQWDPDLREALEQPIEVTAPPTPGALAAMTAQRVAQTEPQANLLPAEFSARYQQQFVDRLWMRGLGTVIAVYLFGVMIYFAWLQFAQMGTSKVEQEVANLGPTYTNALQLKARFEVLKTTQELKYAALDCWKAVAEVMPDGVTLEGYNFNDGKRLTLNGTAPSDQAKQLTEFDKNLRSATVNGQQLFDPLAGEHLTYHNTQPNTVGWSCVLELKKGDTL
jgi:hypothetical protein